MQFILYRETVCRSSEGLLGMTMSSGSSVLSLSHVLLLEAAPEASVNPHPQQAGHINGMPGKTAEQLKQRHLFRLEQGCLHCFAHDLLFLIL